MVALAGILGGLLIEGGKIKDILQFTAAMIVLGGTIGAVMIATPLRVLKGAAQRLIGVFFDSSPSFGDLIEHSGRLRHQSPQERPGRPGRRCASHHRSVSPEGPDAGGGRHRPAGMRKMLEIDITLDEHHGEAEAKSV